MKHNLPEYICGGRIKIVDFDGEDVSLLLYCEGEEDAQQLLAMLNKSKLKINKDKEDIVAKCEIVNNLLFKINRYARDTGNPNAQLSHNAIDILEEIKEYITNN